MQHIRASVLLKIEKNVEMATDLNASLNFSTMLKSTSEHVQVEESPNCSNRGGSRLVIV